MAATDEQYGNRGYGQIGSSGGNPYDARDNYAQGGYDDRTFSHTLHFLHF